jgi:amidophosphoribosyltransferase
MAEFAGSVAEIETTYETEAKPEDECGVFGAWGPEGSRVAELLIYGAHALQHRGQTAAGVAVMGAEAHTIRDIGRVEHIFPTAIQYGPANTDARFPDARVGVSHVRYGTSGESTDTHPYGTNIKVVHNGHYSNIDTLGQEFELPFVNDSESAAFMFEAETYANGGDLKKAVLTIAPKLKGGFGTILTDGNCLIGVRDPNGYRPIVMGLTENDTYILASETVALDRVGATYVQDIEPGQVVVIDDNGVSFEQLDAEVNPTPCLLEDIYFADERSLVKTPEGDLETVRDRRIRFGRELAKEHPRDADFIISVPTSADPAAEGYADESDIPLLEDLLIINPEYKGGRSFIQPTQELRIQATQKKFLLNPARIEEVRGKRLVIIDDSVIRGTTMRRIRQLFAEAEVEIAEFHGLSASPPTPFDCFMGVDLNHDKSPLLLAEYNLRDAAVKLGLDSLGFLSLEGIARAKRMEIADFCTSCFTGKYETEVSIIPTRLAPFPGMIKRF